MRKPILITVVLLVVIVSIGVFYVYWRDQNGKTATVQESQQASAQPVLKATITFDGDSFEPEVTTAKVGATIKVVNQSSAELLFTAKSPLGVEKNLGNIDPDLSKSFVTDAVGTWSFKNDARSGQNGEIIVE